MQMFKRIIAAAVILALFIGAAFATEGEGCASDINIPSIQAFDEAIAPSCHKYMPAKDYTTVRKHVPNMVAQAEKIADLKLDSTYADVAENFYEKRQAFMKSMDNLVVAAEGEDNGAFVKAFDKMQASFEAMTASLVSAPTELEKLHGYVAEIWHKMLPEKDYEGIKKSIPALEAQSRKLADVDLGEAHKDIKEKYQAAVNDLQASIAKLDAAIDTKSDEAIQKAAGDFHQSFEKLMQMF